MKKVLLISALVLLVYGGVAQEGLAQRIQQDSTTKAIPKEETPIPAEPEGSGGGGSTCTSNFRWVWVETRYPQSPFYVPVWGTGVKIPVNYHLPLQGCYANCFIRNNNPPGIYAHVSCQWWGSETEYVNLKGPAMETAWQDRIECEENSRVVFGDFVGCGFDPNNPPA